MSFQMCFLVLVWSILWLVIMSELCLSDWLFDRRFCGMVQFKGDVRKKVLVQLLILLCHPFPVVRPLAGDFSPDLV